ncbi:MAG: single-stranded DNA-binding protein [Clostridia bacterium]|jgi:single-strand DNA-binding protein|nr:single-stranded DNA-binding protein [Clostridia bacterium]MDD4145602.1 single-stranded DNA-binding protein [Clostridia bacterium]MDD4665221.1 single-stranded DNA-binding protein [Clostridia bacterium]
MLNCAVLIGRLTKDPELRYTPSGVAVASFTLAVDRSWLNQQGEKEADFIPIVVWRKQAESCANYIGKGSLVAVQGRIQVRTYEAKDGQRRWVTEVIADNVRFLDKRGSNTNMQGMGSVGSEAGNEVGSEVEFTEEDIPF